MLRHPHDRLLLRAATPTPVWLTIATLAGIAAGVAELLLPDTTARALDVVLAGHATLADWWPLVIVVGAVVATNAAYQATTARLTATGTAWLRNRLTGALLTLRLSRTGLAPGDAVSRLTGDAALGGAAAATAVALVLVALTSIGAVVALVLLGWWLAVVFAVSLPITLLLARSHVRHTADSLTDYRTFSGELSARLLDATEGIRTIAATGTADQETARVLRPLPNLARAGIAMWRAQATMAWRAALLLPTVQLAMLGAAGYGVLTGRLTAGQLLAALGYSGMGMGLVGAIPLLTTLATARAAAERITEVLGMPRRADGDTPLPPGAGTLELRQVTVYAEDGTATLRDIDLTLPAGSTVAVVGRSGAGKTTLAAVAGGLLEPDRGSVALDGANLTTVRPAEIRAAIGYAFDRPNLLGETVSETIGQGTDADLAAIRAAATSAQVDDAVVRLPQGYRTPMADTPLSGGEAQRLGLARALVRDPRLLILDDATASLDTVTEQRVNQAIRTSLPGRTSLVSTHRVAIAASADLVAWLEDGRLRALAAHRELWQYADYRAVFTEARG
ncbi:MAG TPA: ABC transporter ATP-binding protein [Pseudonocardiaceae bacterium]|jgi:ATP-binding cassette subfamily B protein|nr:ABC transporter ATP-binding protein [Pseudonocardiaceae bacterium]